MNAPNGLPLVYRVSVINGGTRWFLRGTTWTSELDRADLFDSESAAADRFEKARKFMKAALARKVEVHAVEPRVPVRDRTD